VYSATYGTSIRLGGWERKAEPADSCVATALCGPVTARWLHMSQQIMEDPDHALDSTEIFTAVQKIVAGTQ
jgi:hypothetical protein